MIKKKLPIQLGIHCHHTSFNCRGKKVDYRYSYVNLESEGLRDKEGWVKSEDALPVPFDLQDLKIKGKSRILHGWWDGSRWYGLRLKPDDIVEKWRWS